MPGTSETDDQVLTESNIFLKFLTIYPTSGMLMFILSEIVG